MFIASVWINTVIQKQFRKLCGIRDKDCLILLAMTLKEQDDHTNQHSWLFSITFFVMKIVTLRRSLKTQVSGELHVFAGKAIRMEQGLKGAILEVCN